MGRGACGTSGRTPSFSVHQIGTLTSTTKAALARTAICGRPHPWLIEAGRVLPGRAGAASRAPSNRRRASWMAASRRAGRGGGGSGMDAKRSLSVAICLQESMSRLVPHLLPAMHEARSYRTVSIDLTSQAGAGRMPIGKSLAEPGHGRRGLGGTHQLDELGSIAEFVLSTGRADHLQHVVVGHRSAVAPAAQQFGKRSDAGGETGIARRFGEGA